MLHNMFYYKNDLHLYIYLFHTIIYVSWKVRFLWTRGRGLWAEDGGGGGGGGAGGVGRALTNKLHVLWVNCLCPAHVNARNAFKISNHKSKLLGN